MTHSLNNESFAERRGSSNSADMDIRVRLVEQQLETMARNLARAETQLQAYAEAFSQSTTFGPRIAKTEKRLRRLTWQMAILLPVTAPIGAVLRLIYNGVRKIDKKRKIKRVPSYVSDASVVENDFSIVTKKASNNVIVRAYNGQQLDAYTEPSILLVKPDHIGDLFLAFPAIELLKSAWPNGKITLVCAPGNIEIARNTGLFHDVRGFPFFANLSENVKKATQDVYSGILQVVPEHYDIAIDLRHDDDTRLLLGFVNATVKAGFDSHGARFTPLDISLPQIQQDSALHRNPHNVHRLNLLVSQVINTLQPVSKRPIENLLSLSSFENPLKDQPYAVLAPGAGTKAKKWSPASYSALAKALHEQFGLKILLIGGPSEQEYSEAIINRVGAEHVTDFIGKLPLKDMPKAIVDARIFIGNDTGATHLAAMMDIPTVAIFSGVADFNIWRPMGAKLDVVKATVGCSPCHIARIENCVADHTCMKSISVDLVLDIIRHRLSAAETD